MRPSPAPDRALIERLDKAYRATAYHVRLPAGEIVLRVGEAAPFLDDWLTREGLTCWALLTAWNPGSRQRPAAENHPRQNELRQTLEERGYRIFPGENRAFPPGSWPPEPTFFTPALKRDEALELARFFGQNALLRGSVAHPPQLLWTII
jgi:hypothetical protein